MIYLHLFYEFFKTGLFSIGGGMATLPFLSRMGEKTGWFSAAELANMIAVSESTPGAIGINMASYVGYTTAGIFGLVVATLGLVAPSIIVIIIIAAFLKSFRENKYVERVFYGVRPASTGLVGSACITLISMCLFDFSALGGAFASFVRAPALLLFAVLWVFISVVKPTKKLHPIVFIAASAVCGIVFRLG